MQEAGTLIVIKGYNRGEVYKLGARNVTAGRDTGNLIQLLDKQVSRRHFLIRSTSEGYLIHDLSSANGTSLNGKPISHARLQLGDTIKAGSTYFKVVSNLGNVEDASLAGKVTDQKIAAATTDVSDIEEDWEENVGPQLKDVIDTVTLDQERMTTMDKLLLEMQSVPDYLSIALDAINRFICPDRAVVLTVIGGTKLRTHRSFFHPQLDKDDQQREPAFVVIKEAVFHKKRVIDNKLEQETEREPATAMAVPILSDDIAIGAIYIDSFPHSRKQFMELDTDLLEKIAQIIAGRWRSSGEMTR